MPTESPISALRERFSGWLASGRIVHATALCQPDAQLRAETLAFFAHALLCQGDGKPCGACSACSLTAAGSHPDDLVLAQGAKGVGDVRALVAELGNRRWMGGWRPVRIPYADALTPQAQNALLKTLEEPPEGTVFLLGSANEDALLPTIRSRCLMLHEAGLPRFEDADVAAAKNLLSPDAAARVKAANQIDAHGALDALESMLSSAVRVREGIAAPETVPPETARFTIAQLLDMIEAIGQTRRRLLRHIAWPMALEGLLLCFEERSLS